MALSALSHAGSTEAEHLRTLLEKQPSCLMRVGLDGVMLAVNEAALRLLDAPDLASVVGRSIAERIAPEQFAKWSEFSGQAWTNGAGSFECRLVDRSGAPRIALVRAVALRGDHDGVDSILVTVRDISGARELERTLQEHDAGLANFESAQVLLEGAIAREQVLVARMRELEVERERHSELLKESESARQRIEAHHLGERAPLQALAEKQQLALLEQEHEHRKLLRGLHTQLAQAAAEQEALRAANEGLMADQARAQTEYAARRVEQEALRAANEGLMADQARAQTEYAAGRAEQEVLRAANEGLRADQTRAQAESATSRAELERALTSVQEQAEARLTVQDRETSDLQRRLAEVLSDREGLAAIVKRNEIVRWKFEGELARARADASSVKQQLNEAVQGSEQRQQEMTCLQDEMARLQTEMARLQEEGTYLQRQVADAERESERLTTLLEQQDTQNADLLAQVADAQGDHKRLLIQLAESEAHQMRLTAEYSAEQLRTRREMAEQVAEQNRAVKALADDNVELRYMKDNARTLESLAATGRLAREIGGELHATTAQLDADSTNLLSLTPLEAAYRTAVEALRVDALRAAGLARQLMQPDTRPGLTGQKELTMLSLVQLPTDRHASTDRTSELRAAPRLPAGAVGAITGLRIPAQGDSAILINISETGLLAECGQRMTPGSKIAMVVEGTFTPTTLRGRVVRTSVAALGANGRLRYHVGVKFDVSIKMGATDEPVESPTVVAPESPVRNRW